MFYRFTVLVVLFALGYSPILGQEAENKLDQYDPVTDNTAIEKPTVDQQHQIDTLFSQIQEVEQSITSFYPDLKELNMIDEHDYTVLDLKNIVKPTYGTTERNLYTEYAIIKWQGKEISKIIFKQRKSLLGSDKTIRRIITYNVMPEGTDTLQSPINVIAQEFISDLLGGYTNYRYPSTTGRVRDHRDEMVIEGQKREVPVVYIRDVDSRVSILREHLRLLRVMELRIRYYVYRMTRQKRERMQRFIQKF